MIIQGKMQYAHWNTYFASPERGKIMKVEAIPQEKNASGRRNTTANNKLFLNPKCVWFFSGNRLSWTYLVTYADGETALFNLACPSLPVRMNAAYLDERMKSLRSQKCREDFTTELERTRNNVMTILASRNCSQGAVEHWRIFFDVKMPQSASQCEQLIGDTGSLLQLRCNIMRYFRILLYLYTCLLVNTLVSL